MYLHASVKFHQIDFLIDEAKAQVKASDGIPISSNCT